MAVPEAAVGATLVASTIVATSFFDVPITTLAAGVVMCAIGVTGRAAFDIQKALKRGEPVIYQRIIGWVAAGLVGSLSSTVAVMVVIKQFTSAEPGGMVAFGLLAFGFGGQDIVGPVWNKAKVYLNKIFGLNLDVDPPPKGQTP
jgi:hypothetical protein